MGTLHNLNGAGATLPMCPLSIKAVEASALIGGEGPAMTAGPCLGGACMAYAEATDPNGAVRGDCRLCLAPQTINVVAEQLAVLAMLINRTINPKPEVPDVRPAT